MRGCSGHGPKPKTASNLYPPWLKSAVAQSKWHFAQYSTPSLLILWALPTALSTTPWGPKLLEVNILLMTCCLHATRPFMQSNLVWAASAHWNTMQYSTSNAPQRSASRDLQGCTGERGINITKQNSVQCKVCTCVAIPRYQCLNYTGCWGGGREGGGGGRRGGRRIGNKWEANCKEVTNQCSQVRKFWAGAV